MYQRAMELNKPGPLGLSFSYCAMISFRLYSASNGNSRETRGQEPPHELGKNASSNMGTMSATREMWPYPFGVRSQQRKLINVLQRAAALEQIAGGASQQNERRLRHLRVLHGRDGVAQSGDLQSQRKTPGIPDQCATRPSAANAAVAS
jgi:hypothetical protein